MKGYSWCSFLWTVDSLVEADPPKVLTSHVSLPEHGKAAIQEGPLLRFLSTSSMRNVDRVLGFLLAVIKDDDIHRLLVTGLGA